MSTFNEFTTMLNDYKFDIIALTETWLQDNNQHQQNYVQIAGYNPPVFKNRSGKKGGGVGFYVKESITFKERKDLTKHHESLEVLFIEIQGRNKNNPSLICVAYQPSSNETDKLEWLEQFERLLGEVYTKWQGNLIITGDFNINLLGEPKESTNRYKDILHTFSLYQHISKPTRKRKTLIDHISSNIKSKEIHHDVINTDEISDHDTPYVILNIKKERFEKRYKYVRNEKNLNMNNYIADFKMLPTSLIYSFDDPDDQISTLNQLVTQCISEHAPTRRVQLTRPPAPWMNDPEIVKAKQHLEYLRKTSRDAYHKDPNTRSRYLNAKNTYKTSIKSKKASFIKKALSSKNPKEVWATINRILYPPKKRIKQEPNKLNSYYATLASKLCKKDNTAFDPGKLTNLLPEQESLDSFVIKHTTFNEVKKIILQLRNDCSSGFDNIPVKFIKPVVDEITSPVVHIINSSIDKELFPDNWKIARVCPVPKVDNPLYEKDFRPISILPILSKVYEKVILQQLIAYIDKSAIYNTTQSGFRKGHSTQTMLLKFRDDIQKALNRNEITMSVLIDYSKAFDTINHEILVKKLINLNFSKSSIRIIMSYLTNRHQYTQVDDVVSCRLPIYFGVPQGSILGPVLFNIYVADLSSSIKSDSIQYADDTTIYKSCKRSDITHTVKQVETDISNLCKWSINNGLLFNRDKLKFIVFSKKRGEQFTNKSILMRSAKKSIPQETSVKLLGLTFDQHLTWTTHINSVIKSAYGILRTLKSFKRSTPFKVRKCLAECLVLSRLSYCAAVYGQSPQYLQKRLQRVQNCTAGYVFGRYGRILDVINLNWLPINENIDYNTVKLAYQALNDPTWPTYLHTKAIMPKRNLRSSNSGPRIDFAESNTFQSQATIFNSLPQQIRESATKSAFNKSAREYYKKRALERVLSL